MGHNRSQKSWIHCLSFLLGITVMLTGCGEMADNQTRNADNNSTTQISQDAENINLISPTSEIVELEDVVLTEFVAADLGVSVGDTVTVARGLSSGEYVVSGIYQCANDMGMEYRHDSGRL